MGIKVRSTPGSVEGTVVTGYPDDQLYMLKLCLELQLEALLLALGSSAVVSRPGRTTASGETDTVGVTTSGVTDPAALPWSRWLAEDLELTCALTRDCVDDGVALPSSMGLPLGLGSENGAEALAARYSAMGAVVGEMLERIDPTRHPHAVARLSQTYRRCEERLAELLGPPAGDRIRPPSGRQSVPGHYLG